MIVGRSTFDDVLMRLKEERTFSLDTETTGLRPYHGDRLFSLILGTSAQQAYYFNFWPTYDGVDPEQVLSRGHLQRLKVLFDLPDATWYIHKFNFDMHVLWAEGLELAGQVWCTLNQGRVEYNEHFNYDLASSLQRMGLAKDAAVEDWIDEHKAWQWQSIPGKAARKKDKFYYRVPFPVIAPYGLSDATGCFALGAHQRNSIERQAGEYPPNVPSLLTAARIEQRLVKTVFRMERVGVKIDRAYCVRATQYERDRLDKASQAFKAETGKDYSASAKLFEVIFSAERDLWAFTEKGNPSFESDTLKRFAHPAARQIVQIRAAKSKLDFYNGFLWQADRDDVIHAQFKPGGTRTFRFSSSEPNLQNLTSEEASYCRACKEGYEQYVDKCPDCGGVGLDHPEFLVRRAIIPRPGFVFCLPDYDQMEYKMMLDYSKHMMVQELKARNQTWDESYFELANKVREGFDVHQASAELMGVPRKYAKTLNFLLLYGGGPAKLAAALGLSLEDAIALREKYFRTLPYIQFMIGAITRAVRERGWVRNWAGYKYNFPDRSFAYTGPNTVVQGGCAAVNKCAMNEVDGYLLDLKSRMVLTIHDELPTEVHESEIQTVPRKLVELMENVYPHKYIPLTAGMEWSDKSLADKKKGYPV